jgi:hypothetical protein
MSRRDAVDAADQPCGDGAGGLLEQQTVCVRKQKTTSAGDADAAKGYEQRIEPLGESLGPSRVPSSRVAWTIAFTRALLKPFACFLTVFEPGSTKTDWATRVCPAISRGVDQSSHYGTLILFDVATDRLRRSRAVRRFPSVSVYRTTRRRARHRQQNIHTVR